MSVVLGVAVGFLAVRFLRLICDGMLRSPVLERRNYRDQRVATAGGLLIVLAVLLVEAGRAGFGALGVGDENTTLARNLVLIAALGFGLLGLLDDVLGEAAGSGGARGFGGHLRALARGRVTTGLLKLLGGVGVAVVLVAAPGFAEPSRLVLDGALIALAANLGNLLDRAPGRTIKVAVVAWVPLAIALGAGSVGVAIAPVMGAALGLLPDDLRERLMLGDTGSNVLGGVLGLAVVLGCGESTRLIVLIVVAALNLLAELVSFNRVIDGTPPLRAFDRLGRR